MNRDVSTSIGRATALAIAVETIVFAVSLILEMALRAQLATNLGYLASLLIAVTVVIMMSCFYLRVSGPRRIFGLLALVSSVLYAPFCVSTYFLQLTVVTFNPGLSSAVLDVVRFKPGSPMFALDMMGYAFLSLSTLAAGFALTDARDKALRILCFFHGALAVPTIASPIMSGVFLSASGETDNTGTYVLLFWCAVFVPIALLFMRSFREPQRHSVSS